MRCKSYLGVSKLVLDKSSADVHRNRQASSSGKLETKIQMQDRMCEALFERDNKYAFLQRFETRQKHQQQVDNKFLENKKMMKSLNDGDENDYCQLGEADEGWLK